MDIEVAQTSVHFCGCRHIYCALTLLNTKSLQVVNGLVDSIFGMKV